MGCFWAVIFLPSRQPESGFEGVNSDILVVVDISLSLLACLYVTCVCWWLLLLLVLLLALKNKQVYGSSPWYILLVVLVILITTLVVATGH